MATKKQQRRRQKLQRHEYEEVYVDEEGNVLAPDEAEQVAATSPARKAQTSKPTGRDNNRRAVEPPSWRKTLRRGLIFFPLMLGAIFLLSPELTTLQKVMNTLVLMAFFIPFSYFMDTMMWRSMQRRLAREGEKKR
jgi:antibiotic biosynthesis monooxygenase (ABM) superfamily enzyme